MTSRSGRATAAKPFIVAAFAMLILIGCGSDDAEDASNQSQDQQSSDPAAAQADDPDATTTDPADELDLTELVAGEDQAADTDPEASEDETQADAPPQTQAAIEAAAFSACMRDQGIDFPDLALNDQGTVSMGTLLERIDLEHRLMQSGLAQCQGELGESTTNQIVMLLQDQTLEDGLAAFSTCVRGAGYDVGDLTVPNLLAGALSLSGDGVASTDRMLAAGLGLDPDNPSDLAAVDGCDEIVAEAISDLGLGG